MKKAVLALAAGSSLALASVATAGSYIEEVINLGNFTAPGGQSIFVGYNNPDNLLPVVGFTISFDYDTSADSFAWGSDLWVGFGGWNVSIGGFESEATWEYDFQGSGSSDSGFYTHTQMFDGQLMKSDLEGFTLQNDYGFNGAVSWNNITITLHKIPAPGALALLGVAGLAGARRRRA